ncbi:tetrapyrrole methylase, partial [Gorgonomyces haynaldii]
PEREHGLYLIGSGPGDPRLLTTEASELIKTLPVIITDKLISPQILEMIPSTTKIYYANKTCGKQIQGQTDIDKWILQHLASGESVGRLKSGDPFIFGRGGEEWLLSTSHGFKCFYIAGISSSLSCGQVLIPPTHRGIANQVLICTGKTREEVPSHMVPYHPERTLILLMAMGNLSVVVERLFSLGYPESLPCCLIEKITWEDQRSFKCDLRDLLKTRE